VLITYIIVRDIMILCILLIDGTDVFRINVSINSDHLLKQPEVNDLYRGADKSLA
jgi:hypothetical protein